MRGQSPSRRSRSVRRRRGRDRSTHNRSIIPRRCFNHGRGRGAASCPAPAQSKGTAPAPKSKGRGKLGSKGKGKTQFRQHRTGANCTPLGQGLPAPVPPAAEGDGDDSSSFTLGGFAEPVGIPDGGDVEWLPDGADSDSQSGVSEGRYSEGRSSRSDDGHGSGYDLEGIQEQHQHELEALRQHQALYCRQHPQLTPFVGPAGLHRHQQLDLLRRQKLELLDLQEAYVNAHPEQQDAQLAPKEEPAATIDPYL